MQLTDAHRIFIGFKLESGLRRELQSLSGPDKRYVSTEDTQFLRFCELGNDLYVGKVIEAPLSTDRVDDVQRNVLSILRRLSPESRLPRHMGIWACLPDQELSGV